MKILTLQCRNPVQVQNDDVQDGEVQDDEVQDDEVQDGEVHGDDDDDGLMEMEMVMMD